MAITLTTVTSGYNLSAINANFQSLQTALNNSVLWRAGSVAGEAQMQRDLDMNGHSLLNFSVDVDQPGSLLTVGVADSRYVNVTGDTMSGPLAMGNNKVTGVAAGTSGNDVVNKTQLDGETEARTSADASLQSQISGATPVLIEERPVVQYHSNTLANSFVIPDDMNAFSIGPQITINPGQTVTLGDNSYWNILGNVFEADELYNVTANNLKTSDNAHTVAVSDIDSVITGPGTVAVTAGSITGITDLAIADGGTGASTAADARTNLGLGTVATQSASSVAITGGSITGITDLAVADGGTGSSTASGARTNLGAAASGANTDITSITGSAASLTTSRTFQTNLASTSAAGFNGTANNSHGVTGTLPLTNGGTGATTAAAARASLGAAASAGVTDASNAAAGVVGELLSNTTSGVSLTTSTPANITSVVLTPGDWDVDGSVRLSGSATAMTAFVVGTTLTSAAQAPFPQAAGISSSTANLSGAQQAVPTFRVNVSSSTTVYLTAITVFSSGTMTADGFIRARRVR